MAAETFNHKESGYAHSKPETFFFDEDNDGHWYMIPSSKRKLWSELVNHSGYGESEEWQKKWDEAGFNGYMTGGGISGIDFVPKNTTI